MATPRGSQTVNTGIDITQLTDQTRREMMGLRDTLTRIATRHPSFREKACAFYHDYLESVVGELPVSDDIWQDAQPYGALEKPYAPMAIPQAAVDLFATVKDIASVEGKGLLDVEIAEDFRGVRVSGSEGSLTFEPELDEEGRVVRFIVARCTALSESVIVLGATETQGVFERMASLIRAELVCVD